MLHLLNKTSYNNVLLSTFLLHMTKAKVNITTASGFDVIDLNDLKNGSVVMSNVVVRAAQTLSLVEKRVLMAAVSKMKDRTVELSATEYAETYGIELNKSYQHLKSAVNNLFERYLTVNVKDGKHTGIMRIRWVSAIRYVDGLGKVEIGFSHEIMPQLANLKGQFTKYQLKQAAALRSVHSWRLLELLEQMRQKQGEGYLMISIDDFHHAMEASKSYRSNFNLLKVRIIEPAIKELNEKDGWAIDYIPLKKGRKVVALRFDFVKDKQLSLLNPSDPIVRVIGKSKVFDENNWIPG